MHQQEQTVWQLVIIKKQIIDISFSKYVLLLTMNFIVKGCLPVLPHDEFTTTEFAPSSTSLAIKCFKLCAR